MSATETQPVLRPTSRIVVLDPSDRVLMFFANIGHSVEPDRLPNAKGFWAVPGGGVDPGETHEVAAIRELREETGITIDGILPCVAERDVSYPWKGKTYRSAERYFFARSMSTALDTGGWQASDQRWMSNLGWWTADALERTQDIVRPPGLARLVRALIAGRIPPRPIILPA